MYIRIEPDVVIRKYYMYNKDEGSPSLDDIPTKQSTPAESTTPTKSDTWPSPANPFY